MERLVEVHISPPPGNYAVTRIGDPICRKSGSLVMNRVAVFVVVVDGYYDTEHSSYPRILKSNRRSVVYPLFLFLLCHPPVYGFFNT